MKLYDHKGKEIVFVKYREAMGFYPYLIAEVVDNEELPDETEIIDSHIIASDYLDQDFDYASMCDPLPDEDE